MAGGGCGCSSGSAVQAFFARLKTDLSGVSATLTLLPYGGNTILVNGRTVTVPDAGLTRGVASNLIDATGADAGASGAANTLYYVYVSNAIASFSPSSIRLSATAPSIVDGVKYLGIAGNALNWRFVGWVYLNATPNFESSVANRLIVNYYNRLALPIYLNPGYVNDNADTTYSTSSATWVLCNGGTGASARFISNGEDSTDYEADFSGSPANQGYMGVGVGEDSVTDAANIKIFGVAALNQNLTGTCSRDAVFSEGLHTLNMLFFGVGGFACSLYADWGRRGGAAADQPATTLRASLMG